MHLCVLLFLLCLCADSKFRFFFPAGDTAPKRPAGSDGYATRAGLELGGWLFLGGTVQVCFCGDRKGATMSGRYHGR